jgi:hypothetical protein
MPGGLAMAYRDLHDVLRAREKELLEHLASAGRRSADVEAERRGLEAELARIRTLLDPANTATALLERTVVASPCSESWEGMSGDDRARFCARCGKNVFNLSAMARDEAERFLVENTGACFRLYRRADGTVLTSDCPVGISQKRRLAVLRHATAIALGLAAAGVVAAGAKAVLAEPPEAHSEEGKATMGF